MKAVVTGGAGFIGSHLVDRLVADGHQVAAVDNLVTGRTSNLDGALSSAAAKFYELDVLDRKGIEAVIAGADWVFHLAAMADIVPSITDPGNYHRANVDGTFTVLEAARAAGVKRFIYAASSSCYGIPDQSPTPETAPPRPMYPYALTKYVGEQYVLHWAATYGLPALSFRLFNVFGPRHRTSGTYGAVFGVFLAQKLAGQPLTIVGDGTQTRDFTYVTDVADALVTGAHSKVVNDVFNVGSGGTYSVNALAEMLGGPRVTLPKRPGEPDSTFADTTKIRNALGWQPKVSFEVGVRRMLASIEDWRDAPVWTTESIHKATEAWFSYLGRKNV
jgi:UDP-glucose 4-epimerase